MLSDIWQKVFFYTVNILVNNVHDYDFYLENINLIKGVSRIWNVPIHLTESINDDDFHNKATKNNYDNSDDNGIYTIRYIHTNDCALLIAVTVNYIYFYTDITIIIWQM